MKITILPKGTLLKYFDGEKECTAEVPKGCTCEEALEILGIHWKEIRNFGFVAINGKRVMITDSLQEGDQLKVYPKIGGG